MSNAANRHKLYPHQVAATERFTRSVAAVPVGQPLLTTMLALPLARPSILWIKQSPQ